MHEGPEDERWQAIVCITALQDARLVLMEGYSWGEAHIDWREGARGEFDLWSFGIMRGTKT